MIDAALSTYVWSREGFLRAHDAGAFDTRVELVNGEVWPVILGDWHGETTTQLVAVLVGLSNGKVTQSTLSSGESLPDPDCWVRRSEAEPAGQIGNRLSEWDSSDVLLVVEVSDEPVTDLNTKSALYGSCGYPTYWVVTRDVIYEHTDPIPTGYRTRVEYRPGDQLPVRYADTALDVSELLADA
jgi:hypothetical protein